MMPKVNANEPTNIKIVFILNISRRIPPPDGIENEGILLPDEPFVP